MGVAKVTFIPHHKNNYWPLALRHRTLAYTSSFLILTKLIAVSALALTPNLAELSTITDSRMVQLTNNARTEAGLPPLTISTSLTQAAKLKGQDMIKHQYFAHISPSGITPWFWMKKTNYAYQVAGENLAIDFLDAEEVVTAWLKSPTHKANLLHKEYTQTGIAVVSGEFQGGTSVIIVHMFGKPLAEAETITETVPETEKAPIQESTEPTPIVAGTTQTTPTPIPIPAIPKTPRISLLHEPSSSEDEVVFRIDGDKNNSAILLINNQERSITTIPDSGSTNVSLPAKNLPSGSLAAKVFTRDTHGTESFNSSTIVFKNPAAVPEPASRHVLALSPAFDRQQIATVAPSPNSWQLFSLHSPITINSHVINALPSFAIREDGAASGFSASIVHTTRTTTALILTTVSCLLILAIGIRIRTQHPELILHASLVIVLACSLLIW